MSSRFSSLYDRFHFTLFPIVFQRVESEMTGVNTTAYAISSNKKSVRGAQKLFDVLTWCSVIVARKITDMSYPQGWTATIAR